MASVYTPVEMLRKLIAFDTTSHKSNLELIHFVEDYLSGHGVSSSILHNSDASKANLIARIGSDREGGIVLAGHTDVVPAAVEGWNSDPFTLTQCNGALYGRGACDMKGFIAIVLAMVPEFLRLPLKTPLHILLTYDEETTCAGARDLMHALPIHDFAPAAVIIGEPTHMKMVDAHKGHYVYETDITGREAHSSFPHQGVNTIFVAAELIQKLQKIAGELQSEEWTIRAVTPPHSTVNVGTIQGGVGFNIVPSNSRFSWEVRPVPGFEPMDVFNEFQSVSGDLERKMQKVAPSAEIKTKTIVAAPAFSPEANSAAKKLVTTLTGGNDFSAISFGTEAPFYQQAGIPTVIFGPGNIANAHQPNEFISAEQMKKGSEFVSALCHHLQSSTL